MSTGWLVGYVIGCGTTDDALLADQDGKIRFWIQKQALTNRPRA